MPAVIRLARADDGPALAAIYRPAVADSVISFELDPPDGLEMGRRVLRTLVSTPWLVCEHDGGVHGYAYAGPHRERAAYRWSVDVSAYVHADARRTGVGRALYASLFAVLARQGYRNAFAGITLPNEASVALHAALGFAAVGVYHRVGYKLGAWHDVGWYERPLAPRMAEPPEPVPLPALAAADGAGLAALLAAGTALARSGGTAAT